jgi:hypothetical protein
MEITILGDYVNISSARASEPARLPMAQRWCGFALMMMQMVISHVLADAFTMHAC